MNYSIIIPHKNCLDLLLKCVESIPNRDDVEIIVVDDDSNDQEGLCRSVMALNRNNTKVICTHEAKGGGYARNIGLQNAKGKWLLFSDSDDYFTKDAFDIFDSYLDTNHDIVFFKHVGVFADTGERTPRSEYRNELIDNFLNRKNKETEIFLRYNNAVPWAKMVRHQLVINKEISFEEVPASNDTMFSTKIGHYAATIGADSRIVYVATVRKGSITHTKSKERYFSDYAVYVRRNSFLKECKHPECQTRLLGQVIYSLYKYGPRECFKYLSYARKYRVNVFWGALKFFSNNLSTRLKNRLSTNKYSVSA